MNDTITKKVLSRIVNDCGARYGLDAVPAIVNKVKKFGFEFQTGFNMAQVAQNYWGYGFKSDEDRAAAHKKYLEYEAKKKDEPKKDEPKK